MKRGGAPEKHRAGLDRQKAYREKRNASETEDQRGEKLAQKRSCQQQRLLSETEEQRGARLVQQRIITQS